MNIDAELRYDPVVKQIKESNATSVPILEVGSGTNGISDYYSGSVIGVDSNFTRTKTIKNKNITHKKGTITNLPFNDKSFQVVVCVDTFEHLSPEVRPKALKELYRVTGNKGVIYLGFPSGDLTPKFERIINSLFKKVHGYNHPWLIEHFDNGLPQPDEVFRYLDKLKTKPEKITILKNVNLLIWLWIHWLFTINDCKKIGKLARRLYNPIYYLSKVPLPPYYRVILVIQK